MKGAARAEQPVGAVRVPRAAGSFVRHGHRADQVLARRAIVAALLNGSDGSGPLTHPHHQGEEGTKERSA